MQVCSCYWFGVAISIIAFFIFSFNSLFSNNGNFSFTPEILNFSSLSAGLLILICYLTSMDCNLLSEIGNFNLASRS